MLVLPSSWELLTIEQIASSEKNAIVDGPFGSNLKLSDYVPSGIPVLQGKNITGNKFVWRDVRFISHQKATELIRSKVRVGDVLIVKIGSIGYSAIIDDLQSYPFAIIPANLAKITPNTNKILSKFLIYYLNSPEIQRELMNRASKTAQPALSLSKIKTITIPVPPLAEQERIVGLLDEAEQLRKLRGQASARMEDFVPALFHEMFGDLVRNEKKWNKTKFSQLGQLDRGKSRHRPRDAAFLYGGKYPFVQTGDIANSNGQITTYSQTYSEEGLAQSKLWPAGTLCITIAANIGKTGILTFPACFPDSIVGFTPNNSLVDVEYLRQWVVTIEDDLDSIAPQSAQKNINLGILRELDVPLPPIDLQREFAQRVQEARGVQSMQARSEERVEALYQSMLSRAFAGEL